MPIQDRQPETDGYLTSHPVKVTRPGGIEDGMYAPSPGVLLSPGTPTLQAPVPAPARALALDALRLIRLLRDPARRPERWQQPSFGEEVELIRRLPRTGPLAPHARGVLWQGGIPPRPHHARPRGPERDPAGIRAPLVGAPRWGDRPVLAVPAELERRRATPPASSADPVRTSTYKK